MQEGKPRELEDWIDRHPATTCIIERTGAGVRVSLLARYPHKLSNLTPDQINYLHDLGKLPPAIVEQLTEARILA
jgi:hypothetical protein